MTAFQAVPWRGICIAVIVAAVATLAATAYAKAADESWQVHDQCWTDEAHSDCFLDTVCEPVRFSSGTSDSYQSLRDIYAKERNGIRALPLKRDEAAGFYRAILNAPPPDGLEAIIYSEPESRSNGSALIAMGVGDCFIRGVVAMQFDISIIRGWLSHLPEMPDWLRQVDTPSEDSLASVGYINVSTSWFTSGTCVATLVGPDIILTAAHCVMDLINTNDLRDPADIVFTSRDGAYSARGVKYNHIGSTPDFDPKARYESQEEYVRFFLGFFGEDYAFIQLDKSLGDVLGILEPIKYTKHAVFQARQPYTIADGRKENPAVWSKNCQLSAKISSKISKTAISSNGLLALDCEVEKGLSGAPVMTPVDGRWRWIGIYVADTDGSMVREATWANLRAAW